MRVILAVMFLYAIGIASITASRRPEGVSVQGKRTLTWYRLQADELEEDAANLRRKIERHADDEEIQKAFFAARKSYKKLEALVEYFSPVTAKAINGPNLDEVDAGERDVVEAPEGFQVMEEMIFSVVKKKDSANLRMEAARLVSNVNRLGRTAELLVATDVQLFDAMRQELLRIMALGISGFDSPVAFASLSEAKASMDGVRTIWLFYKDEIKDADLVKSTQQLFDEAKNALHAGTFNEFDRLTFISKYLNPLYEKILLCRRNLNIGAPTQPSFLHPDAVNPFGKAAYNTAFYSSSQVAKNSDEQAELGKKLFYDPILSFNNQRNCATCHKPEQAFTDGLPLAASLNDNTQMRNTPTLLNAALQSGQFYDLRVAYLEDQVTDVVNNPSEMHGSLEDAVAKIKQQKAYTDLFNKAFGDTTIHSRQVKVAIAAYIRSLTKMNSRFDQYMLQGKNPLTAAETRGFNLYMGKAKCGTCHFAPLFNGNVPPRYDRMEAEVLGVPTAADSKILDEDEGKYNLYKIDLHRHAFKTPGLRNIALTAPYMHNGIYSTLDEVMEFYNNGGGAGLGINLKNQTLPTDSLHLTNEEKQDVIAFLKTLSDEPLK
ncbi:cytochrome c peroxidase [uncultured Chitinophaga sp.]|uniref:cytochrome-c peroxidase n=1 Tax=uncultured Chitinophaga sp. TaxID=339340 RepID=UPI0025F9FF3B|nr:cytochrome c peroxidase [uncultured Chitinophaga sp.]